MNKLRKFDAAGRMMETSEGELAMMACSWCSREDLSQACMGYKGSKEKGCAYCRRNGKAGCYAGDSSKAPAPNVDERIQAVEKTLDDKLDHPVDTARRLEEHHNALSGSVLEILQQLDKLESLAGRFC